MQTQIIKNIDRLNYIYLLIFLNFTFLISFLLRFFSFIIKNNNKKHDIILFPFAQKGNIGYTIRFQEYFKYFKKDNIDFYICDIYPDEFILSQLNGSNKQRYRLFRKIAWKRLWQVVKARKYKAAFIHRGLFPYYPDLKTPYFEKLLRKLNDNITIDFWDSVWIYNKELAISTVCYADKLSVVNEFIGNYFSFVDIPKLLFPIGVNLDKYLVKTDFSVGNKIKLFYTGNPNNVEYFISLIKPILIELKKTIDFKLIIVSNLRLDISEFEVEYHDFNEKTFFKLLVNSDIGLYMVEETEDSKGKMAMKVLDYMSAGLPCIVTPVGLTPYAEDKKNIYFAHSKDDWVKQLTFLFTNELTRATTGKNGRKTVEKYHSLPESYKLLMKIIDI